MLRAHKPTYIGDSLLPREATVALAESTKIVLGRDGWVVEVYVEAHYSRERHG